MRRLARGLATAQRAVAHIDGTPVLINNLAKLYYDAVATPAALEHSEGDLTGFRVWESAPHLIHFLEEHRPLVQARTVIELGAGTGAVGLSAAALGAKLVVLSDSDSTVTLQGVDGLEEHSRLAMLRDNAQLNGTRAANVSVAPLRWGEATHLEALATLCPGGFETIIASDVLYSPRHYDELATTIDALAARAADTRVILSYPVRHGEEHTFAHRLPAFEVVTRETVGDENSPVEDSSSPLRILELRSAVSSARGGTY
jgi:predicted nicotinamide N-methyase